MKDFVPKKILEILFHRTKSYFEAPRKTLNKIGVMFHLDLTFVYHIEKVSSENIVRKKFVLRKTLSDPNVSLACTQKTVQHSPKSCNILPNCAARYLGECCSSTLTMWGNIFVRRITEKPSSAF